MQNSEPMSVVMSRFTAFLESELGQALLDIERPHIEARLSRLVGNNCLQLSVQRGALLCPLERFSHLIRLGYAPSAEPRRQDSVWADYDELPVASDCVDVAVLHHVLEFSSEPHQLLREANRTLTAGGHLLIAGFNPYSLWPLYRRLYHWRNGERATSNKVQRLNLGSQQSIGQGRLADWLSVLNYDVLEEQHLFYRPPLNSARWLGRLQFCERWGRYSHLPFGLAYVTVARKRNTASTPIASGWRRPLRTAPAAKLAVVQPQLPAAAVGHKRSHVATVRKDKRANTPRANNISRLRPVR
ncbi:MAG: class I SAM-dependent methyltransferase [Gammaproteobacteria bacterium]|nr:class I SAM-dependent methyltransferase [Gammaproteobacteria bacterium]NND38129.1 methyltransferase domain-containing protein [Pseudomonadales bacterium]RZV56092.1 MAG: methyltransferase domain-containing protein [Pseudomonadales bacterium]